MKVFINTMFASLKKCFTKFSEMIFEICVNTQSGPQKFMFLLIIILTFGLYGLQLFI